MAIMAEDKGGDFKQAETGTHPGRCYMILDLGHQRNEWQGEVSVKHQVLVAWELPTQPLLEDGRPVSISKFYTLSLHEKANLGIDLSSWRGRAFSEEEKDGFDVGKLIGVPAMLSIVERNGKSRVGGVMGIPKGMTVPDAINKPILFDLEAFLNGDREVFDELSEGLQGIINRAQEITKPADRPDSDDPFDDDIPF